MIYWQLALILFVYVGYIWLILMLFYVLYLWGRYYKSVDEQLNRQKELIEKIEIGRTWRLCKNENQK